LEVSNGIREKVPAFAGGRFFPAPVAAITRLRPRTGALRRQKVLALRRAGGEIGTVSVKSKVNR